jgi:hypothetical protein
MILLFALIESIYEKRYFFDTENLPNIDYEFFDLPYFYHIKCISFNNFGKSDNRCHSVLMKEGNSISELEISNLGLSLDCQCEMEL